MYPDSDESKFRALFNAFIRMGQTPAQAYESARAELLKLKKYIFSRPYLTGKRG